MHFSDQEEYSTPRYLILRFCSQAPESSCVSEHTNDFFDKNYQRDLTRPCVVLTQLE